MIDLDNPEVYNQYDPQNMLCHLNSFPRLCREANKLADAFKLPEDYSSVDRVMMLGMGGSAISGDLISRLMLKESRVPFSVIRDYHLPAFTGENTLFIASSYSGMTEETLSAFDEALQLNNCKYLIISTKGNLKDIAQSKNIPLFTFNYDAQPRTTLPFGFMGLLSFMQKLGFISNKSADIYDSFFVLEQLLQQIKHDIPFDNNQAKQIAYKLFGKLVIIYGAETTAEVAYRWKTQLNENSKAWSGYETFSELNHNTIVGYQFPQELNPMIHVVMLRSSKSSLHLLRRYEPTSCLLNQAQIKHSIIDACGDNLIAQILSLVLLGDYISYYLAILYKVDPTPIEAIDFLKRELDNQKYSLEPDK